MTIINQSQKTILAEEIIIPKTLIAQSLGLLKYKTPRAMLLKTRYGIHTFGMRYAIDVLIVNKQNCVVIIKENLTPNSVFMWNIKYKTVLEFPAGTLKRTKTKLNDQLIFSN